MTLSPLIDWIHLQITRVDPQIQKSLSQVVVFGVFLILLSLVVHGSLCFAEFLIERVTKPQTTRTVAVTRPDAGRTQTVHHIRLQDTLDIINLENELSIATSRLTRYESLLDLQRTSFTHLLSKTRSHNGRRRRGGTSHGPSPTIALSTVERIHCPICMRSQTEFEAEGHHLMVIQCGHTMCSFCCEGGGYRQRTFPNAEVCPLCNCRGLASRSVRVYLNGQ